MQRTVFGSRNLHADLNLNSEFHSVELHSMRTFVLIAAAFALFSCADALCGSPALLPRTSTPLASLRMVGKDYYHGQASDKRRREAAKRVPFGGYNPETRALQSAPAALYPVPKFERYVGYDPAARVHESSPLYQPAAAPVSAFDTDASEHQPAAASLSAFDTVASVRAQHEIDELHRIKEDFMKRLDMVQAGGVQNNIVFRPQVSVPLVTGLL